MRIAVTNIPATFAIDARKIDWLLCVLMHSSAAEKNHSFYLIHILSECYMNQAYSKCILVF